MTHIPEIGAKNWYWFPDLSDMQFGTEFFWCWFLVTNRTIFVLVYGTSRRQFSVLISGMCVIGIRLLLHVIGDVRTGSWWIFQPSAQDYSNKIQASSFCDRTMYISITYTVRRDTPASQTTVHRLWQLQYYSLLAAADSTALSVHQINTSQYTQLMHSHTFST